MDTMIQRVAQVLADHAGDGRDYSDVARDAIVAMREPDPRVAAVVSVNWTLSPEQILRLHKQMIDTILAVHSDVRP